MQMKFTVICVTFSATVVHTTKDVMRTRRLQQEREGVNRLIVDRRELWPDGVVLFKSPKYPLRIRCEGECGIDAGGLSREYAISFAMHYFRLKQVCLKANVTGNCLCTKVMQYLQIYSLLLARCALT